MRSEEGVLCVSERDRGEEDATKRTYLAQERTLLAWWRSGLAAFAVAIGIGRLVPAILDVAAAPFVALGVGFGTLGLAFVSIGAYRDRAVTRHLAQGRFDPSTAGSSCLSRSCSSCSVRCRSASCSSSSSRKSCSLRAFRRHDRCLTFSSPSSDTFNAISISN
jgi:uncharacterized membrane protein YidH (DUF202 family)